MSSLQLAITDPDFLLNPFARPTPYPPGTRSSFRGTPCQVVQGTTNNEEAELVPYTATGTVSIEYRRGGVLCTAQVPVDWVVVGPGGDNLAC